jgi:ubiquinone/menaquinone biosynthesis C-methylase UbiE
MRQAQKHMERKLGNTLKLSAGSLILDAGCGEGHVAIRLASDFGLNVEGVDLVQKSIHRASHLAHKHDLSTQCHFSVADYSNLPHKDNTFDGVYTMETLVHSPDAIQTLQELKRVLKPGGRLVLFEYSISPHEEITDDEFVEFLEINNTAAMHSLPNFTHGALAELVTLSGFSNVSVEDITSSVIPMLRRFYQIAIIPYQFIKLFGGKERFVNTRSAVAGYKFRRHYRYNVVTAELN